MKRVALLGATGSIGRQAIEVIEANDELELVAASSGSTPIDGLAPLTQTGGDPTELLERARPDVVLNAVVGFAGLAPTMWALEHGLTLALANKESLVAAGELALDARRRGRGELIPVDSEHSALFQCAQLGYPDMRVPISYALTYPQRAPTPVPPLELQTLEFHPPDTETFRLLELARDAGQQGGTYPCAYNAANEVAVQAFLDGRIGFLDIASAVEDVLARVEGSPARDLDELVEAGGRAPDAGP